MPSSPERSLRRFLLPVAALLGVGAALLIPTNPRLENALNRAFPRALNNQVVVVGIDDASLGDYGRLDIWPRELYAQVIRTLDDAGARVIGLDVLLSDPGQNEPDLDAVLNRPNVIHAVSPDEVNLVSQWTPSQGISALNAPTTVGVSEIQTAYPVQSADPLQGSPELVPSFARQVAAAAGKPLPLNTVPWLMPYVTPEATTRDLISFRDVVNGNFRFADVQNRVVLIGLTATGLTGLAVPDIDSRPVAGVLMQARAVSTLLGAPLRRTPLWLTVLLCVLTACAVVLARDLWGFVIGIGVLALSALLWHFNVVLPGATISITAVLATTLVAFERWWSLRALGTRDPLTGLGNRLAFTRAVEHRWPTRHNRPLSLLLLDLNDYRRVSDLYGRLAGEETMRDLAERLQKLKRRSDVLFRWGPEEFAVLLDQTAAQDLQGTIAEYQQNLQNLRYRDLALSTNIGGASTSASLQSPADLIEAASRDRYRRKFQRERLLAAESGD